jgi:glutamine synthetase
MPADLTLHGEPYPLSTRVALKRVLGDAAAMGFDFKLGIECEIFLLRKAADGTLTIPHATDNLVKPCYDLHSFSSNIAWLDKVAAAITSLGWDLYSFDHEDANGQFEFDFNYADALTTCDRLTFFRFMAKKYAEDEGLIATMMPKPFANRTGNGAHFNMSLSDRETGRNLFACPLGEDPRGLGLTKTGYHFIGGILRHGRALCAALAPTVKFASASTRAAPTRTIFTEFPKKSGFAGESIFCSKTCKMQYRLLPMIHSSRLRSVRVCATNSFATRPTSGANTI